MIGYHLKKKKTYTNNKKENIEEGIRNFVDIQAITILLYLSGNPKTRSEMITELREIPNNSLYRKINEMEKFGLIRQIIPSHKKKKRNNITYENTSRNFVIRNRGKVINMTTWLASDGYELSRVSRIFLSPIKWACL